MSATCSLHRSSAAGWRCLDCDRTLCPICAVADDGGVLCAHCAGRASELLTDIEPVSNLAMLPTFVGSLLTGRALLRTVGLVAATTAFQVFCPCFGVLLAWSLLGGYFFMVLRRAMEGEHRLPPLEIGAAFNDVLGPGLRFATPTFLMVLPILGWVWSATRQAAAAQHAAGINDPQALAEQAMLIVWHTPLAVLGVVLVVALWPAMLILASSTESAGEMLSPSRLLGLITAVPGPYIATTALWLVGAAVLTFAQGALADASRAAALNAVAAGVAPSIGRVLVLTFASMWLRVWMLMLGAQVLGWLGYSHAAALGLSSQLAQTPALPGATPRGRLRVPPRNHDDPFVQAANGVDPGSAGPSPEASVRLPVPEEWSGAWGAAPSPPAVAPVPAAPSAVAPGPPSSLPPSPPRPPVPERPAPRALDDDGGWLRPQENTEDSLLAGYLDAVAPVADPDDDPAGWLAGPDADDDGDGWLGAHGPDPFAPVGRAPAPASPPSASAEPRPSPAPSPAPARPGRAPLHVRGLTIPPSTPPEAPETPVAPLPVDDDGFFEV